MEQWIFGGVTHHQGRAPVTVVSAITRWTRVGQTHTWRTFSQKAVPIWLPAVRKCQQCYSRMSSKFASGALAKQRQEVRARAGINRSPCPTGECVSVNGNGGGQQCGAACRPTGDVDDFPSHA